MIRILPQNCDEALSALKSSKETGLAFFFDRYYVPLSHYAVKFLGEDVLGQDIATETFVKLWQRRAELKEGTAVKPLLYRMAYNACIDALRSRKTLSKKQSAYLRQAERTTTSLAETNYDYLVEAETFATLYRSLQTLPPRTQEIFRLFYYQHKSLKQIASSLGVSVNTVKTLKMRGLRQLRVSRLTMPLLLVLTFFVGFR